MKPGCIGKSNTNNLPAPTNLTENPYGKKNFFCFGVSQKSASVVQWGIAVEFVLNLVHVPRRPIFEKCSHLREKGGADAFENDPPFMSKGTVHTGVSLQL